VFNEESMLLLGLVVFFQSELNRRETLCSYDDSAFVSRLFDALKNTLLQVAQSGVNEDMWALYGIGFPPLPWRWHCTT